MVGRCQDFRWQRTSIHALSLTAFQIVLIGAGLGGAARADSPNDKQAPRVPNLEPITISGQVLDVTGEPAVGATVSFRTGGPMHASAEVATDSQGAFETSLRVKRQSLGSTRVRASNEDETQVGYYRFPWDGETTASDSIEIKLEPAKAARLKVVDGDEKPVMGAGVAIQLGFPHTVSGRPTDQSGSSVFRFPESERIEAVVASKDGVGFDYRLYKLGRMQRADVSAKAPEFPLSGEETLILDGVSPLTVRVVDDQQQPLSGIRLYPWLLRKESEPDSLNLSYFTDTFSQWSDDSGEATFDWIPWWQQSMIQVWPSAEGVVHKRGVYDVRSGDGRMEMQLDRLVPIRGQVVDAVGKPAPGMTVSARGAGYTFDGGQASTTTDQEGKYELLVPPDQVYLVIVNDKKWASSPQTGFVVHRNQPVEDKDFKLRPATRVYGTLMDERSEQPIPSQRVHVYQYGQDLHSMDGVELPNPENSRRWVQPMQVFSTTTDQQGRFEFALGDGNFDIRPPQQEKVDKFEIAGQAELEMPLTTEVHQQVELHGTVVDKREQSPLEGVRVSGVPRSFRGDDWQTTTGTDGQFRVKRYQEPAYVHAISADKRLATVASVDALQQHVMLQLQPVGSAQGRLLKMDSSEPFGEQEIDYGIRVPDENERTWSYRFGGRVFTDSDGAFRLDALVAGWEFTLNLESSKDGLIPTLTEITVEPGQSLDLGDLNAPKPPKRYSPPTLEERIGKAFAVDGTPLERHERALKLIQLVNQHLLIVFGDPEDSRVRRLMDIRYNDADFRPVRDEFRCMAIATDKSRRDAAEALANSLDESLDDDRGKFLLVILDRDGNKVATAGSESLCDGDELSKQQLLDLLQTHLTEPLRARELLEDALKQAAAEEKRVIVQETATWCGPCHLLARFLGSHRVWEKDYVWIKVDHRWTARELMKELRDGAEGGIPWFAILSESGQVLVTSNDPETKKNIGYPSSERGRAHFASMLNATRQRLTEQEVEGLVAALEAEATQD